MHAGLVRVADYAFSTVVARAEADLEGSAGQGWKRCNSGVWQKKSQPLRVGILVIGGGGGFRTRVQKHATSSSTYLVRSTGFSLDAPAEQAHVRRFARFSSSTPRLGTTLSRVYDSDVACATWPKSKPVRRPAALSGQSETLVVGSYCIPADLRGGWSSVCPTCFVTPVESKSPPG